MVIGTYYIILSFLKFINIFRYRKNGLKYPKKRSIIIIIIIGI